MSGIDSAFDDRQYEGFDWIEWHGGEQPVPDGTKVELIFRDGEKYYQSLPEAIRWEHDGLLGDVVKYRVVDTQNGIPNTRIENMTNSRIDNMKMDVKRVLAQYREPKQIEGSHYTDMVIEPLDLAVLNNLSPFDVKIVKYATRDKNGLKDIRKAIDMLNKKAMYFYGVNVLEEDNDS